MERYVGTTFQEFSRDVRKVGYKDADQNSALREMKTNRCPVCKEAKVLSNITLSPVRGRL